MPFNAVDAARLLTSDILTDEEVKFLISCRDGRDLDDKTRTSDEFKNLEALGFILQQDYSTPRSNSTIKGVALTDDGIKLMNEIDRRYRENGSGVSPADHAPAGADLEMIRQPTELERSQVITTHEGRKAALAHLKEGPKHKQTEDVKTAKAAERDNNNKGK